MLCLTLLFFTAPLKGARYPQVFSVAQGSTVRKVAEDLHSLGAISSPSLFIISNYLIGDGIVWGSYNLANPQGAFNLALDLYKGDKDVFPIKISIPEESDAYDIADIFERKVENFDRTEFLDVALRRHGYLYPDTYFFAEDYITPEHIVDTMEDNFKLRTDDLFASYEGDFSRDEIVTLASIVELEASRYEDRRKIAGVLFNRLELNMPLQVDVSFLFIEGKNTFQLSREDLNSDDPSNTYKYTGIPPIPITNPSRKSIEAVIDPVESDNLYFLADFYGNTYYSETYDEHLKKRYRYIKNKQPPPDPSSPVTDESSDINQEEGEEGSNADGGESVGAKNSAVIITTKNTDSEIKNVGEGGDSDKDTSSSETPSGATLVR